MRDVYRCTVCDVALFRERALEKCEVGHHCKVDGRVVTVGPMRREGAAHTGVMLIHKERPAVRRVGVMTI